MDKAIRNLTITLVFLSIAVTIAAIASLGELVGYLPLEHVKTECVLTMDKDELVMEQRQGDEILCDCNWSK